MPTLGHSNRLERWKEQDVCGHCPPMKYLLSQHRYQGRNIILFKIYIPVGMLEIYRALERAGHRLNPSLRMDKSKKDRVVQTAQEMLNP